MSVLTQAANSYQFYATNNPILTNSVTGFLIASIGDVLCQKALNSWEKKREREKQLSLLQPTGTTQGQGVGLGQKEFNYFDAQIQKEQKEQNEKIKATTNKIIRSPLKSSEQNSISQLHGTTVKRNVLQNVLLSNKIKKSIPKSEIIIPNNFDQKNQKNNQNVVQNINHNFDLPTQEQSFAWDSVRTLHLGIIRARTFCYFFSCLYLSFMFL